MLSRSSLAPPLIALLAEQLVRTGSLKFGLELLRPWDGRAPAPAAQRWNSSRSSSDLHPEVFSDPLPGRAALRGPRTLPTFPPPGPRCPPGIHRRPPTNPTEPPNHEGQPILQDMILLTSLPRRCENKALLMQAA